MTEPRRFHLQRDTDITGASGTGRVADGVLWPDQTVSIRWRGDRPSTVFWDRLTDAEQVHGHGGHTRIVWAEDRLTARFARIAGAHHKDILAGGLTSGDCAECDQQWPCPTYTWATEDRDPGATWDPADDEPAPPAPTTVPCSLGVLKRPHLSHSWQPQPGMAAVLCAGVPDAPEADGR